MSVKKAGGENVTVKAPHEVGERSCVRASRKMRNRAPEALPKRSIFDNTAGKREAPERKKGATVQEGAQKEKGQTGEKIFTE